MSTQKHKSQLDQAVSGIPSAFRTRLVRSYEEIKNNNLQGRFEATGLAAGKFCEIVLRLLQQIVTGKFTPFGTRIPNFIDECRRIESSPSTAAIESIRLTIPRCIVFLYTMRNKRGIGHVGGDVEANAIDSITIARLSDWTMCELIRIFHNLPLEEAQDLIDTLTTRNLPLIWKVGGKKRVLRQDLSARDQTLLLIYGEHASTVLAEDICSWVEYNQLSMFKRNVLRPLHRARLVEFDEETDSVYLSPTGIKEVETRILKKSAI